MNTRAQAANILVEVLQQQRSLNAVLNEKLAKSLPPQDKGFIQELCYGALRWYEQLAAIANLLLARPLKNKDQDIYVLILLGLYQLLHLQTPAHAAIHETVQAARVLKKVWAANMINAVLRRFQREQTDLLNTIEKEPTVRYAHPVWLLQMLQQAWPEQWEMIATVNNQRPPMTLRINQLKTTRNDYLTLLTRQNIAAHAAEKTQHGIVLNEACDVAKLPDFNAGFVSVQDAAAQLAAALLDLKSGQRVLDACAAPGGKTAHILETEKNLSELVVIDIEEKRLEKIKENLNRLDFKNNIQLICADAAQPENWWDEKLFDRILLDAPCSATGVIRRHPDIKYLRRPADIPQLAKLQEQLLNKLWPLLKPNGILLYATCSVLPQENHEQIKHFLATHDDAQQVMEQQILPGENEMDGFYYAKIAKFFACR